MKPLGKSMVFHLKYMAEMNRIYVHAGNEEPDLTGLDNAEHVREMARIVGTTAYEEAGDFLELCGKEIENHFTGLGIATLVNKKKRAYAVRNWIWDAMVQVSSVPGCCFSCGLYISAPPGLRISMEKDVCGLVVPYLWSKGGRKGADAVWKILGGWADSHSGEGLVDVSGSIALARIPIKAQPTESFDVDRDMLIAEVMNIVARIGAEQTMAIARFTAGLGETEDS